MNSRPPAVVKIKDQDAAEFGLREYVSRVRGEYFVKHKLIVVVQT